MHLYNYMKIDFINTIKYPIIAATTAMALGYAAPTTAQTNKSYTLTEDKFERKNINPVLEKYSKEDLPEVFREEVNPSGWTINPDTLKMAPSPKFKLLDKDNKAALVVDITNCIVFRYDKDGNVIEAFKAATGAPDTPTKEGVTKVVSKLNYPYSTLSRKTKRRRFPRDYGPKILLTFDVDPNTGKLHDSGRYPHGTKHENAIEKGHITHGCTRVHNLDILYLSDVTPVGSFVLFKK